MIMLDTFFLQKNKAMQQTMNISLHTTPGGGTHTRWFHNEHRLGRVADTVADNQAYNNNVNSSNKNFEIAYQLLKISIYHGECGDWIRTNVFRNAAESITKLDFPVTSGNEVAKGDKKVHGIGKGIARLIDEYLNVGTMTGDWWVTTGQW